MNASDVTVALNHLPNLELTRADSEETAGLWMISLPWPAAAEKPLALNGKPTYTHRLGQWHGRTERMPRRILMAADGGTGAAPDTVRLTDPVPVAGETPTASFEIFDRSPDEGFLWEKGLVRIRHGGKSLGLALGLRHNGETHWWEATRLVTIEETPFCRVVQMGGAIPRIHTNRADMEATPGYRFPLLHEHNWLYGDLFIRLYANGVCEVSARHINNRYVDEGADLADVTPVIGMVFDDSTDWQTGDWDGSVKTWSIGGIKFDVAEASRLVNDEQLGRLDREGDMCVWQPYAGVEVYGGVCPNERTGNPWIWRAANKLFPRGMARTVRFSMSFSDRSPHIARYMAPYWWYGQCQELLRAESCLPVSNEWDQQLDKCIDWLRTYTVEDGFESGAIPRGVSSPGSRKPPKPQASVKRTRAIPDTGRNEAGWEGEVPWAYFLQSYRSGQGDDLQGAIRAAYYFTDVCVNHAAGVVRMHGYADDAYALPMNRVQACIFGYLETGDPYLLNSAEKVIECAYRQQRNSWPRMAMGRDACFIRGAVMLYRYFNNDHFRWIARDACHQLAETQNANGSFGDQGGGAGIHQWSGYVTKPWMGLMATAGVVDYLELFPDEPVLDRCARRFGDWLMAARWTRDGFTGWSYQHDYNGEPRHYTFNPTAPWQKLPTEPQWHQDTLARLLGYCTRVTGDSAYLAAWADSYAHWKGGIGDHSTSTSTQCLPWIQMEIWRAKLTPTGVTVTPTPFGELTPREAQVYTPTGMKAVTLPK